MLIVVVKERRSFPRFLVVALLYIDVEGLLEIRIILYDQVEYKISLRYRLYLIASDASYLKT